MNLKTAVGHIRHKIHREEKHLNAKKDNHLFGEAILLRDRLIFYVLFVAELLFVG